eukprot:1157731-Pelagomonas_calceolata.AAC.20
MQGSRLHNENSVAASQEVSELISGSCSPLHVWHACRRTSFARFASRKGKQRRGTYPGPLSGPQRDLQRNWNKKRRWLVPRAANRFAEGQGQGNKVAHTPL